MSRRAARRESNRRKPPAAIKLRNDLIAASRVVGIRQASDSYGVDYNTARKWVERYGDNVPVTEYVPPPAPPPTPLELAARRYVVPPAPPASTIEMSTKEDTMLDASPEGVNAGVSLLLALDACAKQVYKRAQAGSMPNKELTQNLKVIGELYITARALSETLTYERVKELTDAIAPPAEGAADVPDAEFEDDV